jgi:hypothetical protein
METELVKPADDLFTRQLIQSVEQRFALMSRLPMAIQWLSDNGSPYTAGRPASWPKRSAYCRVSMAE